MRRKEILQFVDGITMNELSFHKTASQYQRPSHTKGPRKFPLIELDAKRTNTILDITLITFNEIGRFLTDNYYWIERRMF